MTHIAKLHWIPADRQYQLICTGCGRNFSREQDLELEDLVINIEGDCEPGETLGIHVADGLGVEDHFGGAG